MWILESDWGNMEINEVVAILRASQKLLETKIEGQGYVLIESVRVVYVRYAELRMILQSLYPSLFADLQEQPIPPKVGTGSGSPITDVYYVKSLVYDINYCLDLLSFVVNPAVPSATVTREGVFFTGQFFDALLKITDLITQAQKNIVLIDGYINEDVLKLLTAKSDAATGSILTNSKSVSPALTTAATAFNKQYRGLNIRTSQAFHDRFVIIDDRDFYHFGASIKDLGNRGFMFSRIEEPIVITSLRHEFANEWARASVVV